jgi:hypothetical protein
MVMIGCGIGAEGGRGILKAVEIPVSGVLHPGNLLPEA